MAIFYITYTPLGLTFPSTEQSYEVYLLRTKRIAYIADKFFLAVKASKAACSCSKCPGRHLYGEFY